ncbi:serine/threonine protein kinase, partial [Streptomyces sp. KLMMK]
RQRLTVFVVVTLLVALGIAVAQGCQGPERNTDGLQQVSPVSRSDQPGQQGRHGQQGLQGFFGAPGGH